MKTWILYLKKDKSLYAFTATKKLLYKFLEQRNPKCFIVKEFNLTDHEFGILSYAHKNAQLVEDVFEGENGVVTLVVTWYEINDLETELESIDRYVEEIERIFRLYPLKRKYQKAIRHLTTTDDGKGNLIINTLSLFIDLHIDTFLKVKN